MTEIQGTGGSGPISPRDKKMYEQEFKHAADLFQRSLSEYSKSDNPYQKEEFKEVMDKAMRVLNETAQELTRKELLKQNQKIEQDWAAYQQDGSVSSQEKLNSDLEKAKKTIT
jgi:uncharacterized protein with ATP-grasp and redox domains